VTPFTSTPALPTAALSADQLLAQEAAGAPPQDPKDRYWADREAKDVVAELNKKEKDFYTFLRTSGHLDMWRVAYCQQHGLDPNDDSQWVSQQIGFAGDQDELLYFRINETRSFADQLVTMAIGHRPAFDAFATNTDYDSIGQSESGETIVQYVYESSYGERKERQAVDRAFWYGSSYTWVRWDPAAGDPLPPTQEPKVVKLPDGSSMPALDPTTGEPLMVLKPSEGRTGDLVIKSIAPWNVFCEPALDDPDDHMWRCVKEKRSRYELAGLFPDLRDKILAMPARDEYGFQSLMAGRNVLKAQQEQSDQLVVKHFYHAGSAAFDKAFRNGRRISYVGDIALVDAALEYRVVPVIPLIPKTYYETSLGYSTVWDLICCNQLVDDVMVNAATNLSNFGRQSLWMEEGTSISAKDIVNGGRLLKGKVGSKPPQAVSLAAIPESGKWFLDKLKGFMQSMSGLNSVSRGEPDANISSGTMAALFHSIALEFNSGPQAAVDGHREDVANLILDVLKYSAEHEMILKIAGRDERMFMDSFSRDDLYGVRGVRLRTANPMMRTQAGRMELAQLMLKAAPGSYSPEQIAEVAVSGQVKPLYDAPRKRRMLIKLEDELLQDSPPVEEKPEQTFPPLPNGMTPPPVPAYRCVPTVPVSLLQNHRDHIYCHEALLSSREGMKEGPFRDAVLAHIEHHKHVWQNADPAFLTAMGLPVWPGGPPGGMPAPPAPPPSDPRPGGPMPPGGGGKPMPANDNGAGIPATQRSADDLTGTPLPKPAQPPKAA
jgi:hypothetical protein